MLWKQVSSSRHASRRSKKWPVPVAAVAVVMALALFGLGYISETLSAAPHEHFLRQNPHPGRALLDFQDTTANDGITFFTAFPRRTWLGQDVSPQFCSYDAETNSCNWADYAQSISLVALPSLVIGLFFTLVFGITFCIRCCCVLNRCCIIPYQARVGERLVFTVLLTVACLCILGLAGLGLLGAVWTHQGIDDTESSATDFSNTIINISVSASSLLVELDSSYSSVANTTISDAHDVQNSINDVIYYADKAELARFLVFIAAYGIIVAIVISTFIFMIFFRHFLFNINYWYALVMFVLLFLLLTIYIVTGAVASDMCNILEDPNSSNYTDIFVKLIGSAWGNCSALEEVIAPLESEFNSTVLQLCEDYDSLCSSQSSGLSNCVNCSSSTNETQIASTTITEVLYCGTSEAQYCPSTTICATCPNCTCYNHSQTVASCVDNCLDPYYRNFSSELISNATLVDKIRNTLVTVEPYAGCQIIIQFEKAITQPLCVEFMSGEFLLTLSAIGLCFLWLFYHAFLLLSWEWAYVASQLWNEYL